MFCVWVIDADHVIYSWLSLVSFPFSFFTGWLGRFASNGVNIMVRIIDIQAHHVPFAQQLRQLFAANVAVIFMRERPQDAVVAMRLPALRRGGQHQQAAGFQAAPGARSEE